MNDEADIMSTVMLHLRIPEPIQNRVIEYYDQMLDSMFVKSPEIYNYLSTTMGDGIKFFQIRQSVTNISFINGNHMRQIENFVSNLKISFYLPGDIILKQGCNNDKFYYIHKGIVEVLQHPSDFAYFDFQAVDNFLNHSKLVNYEEINENNQEPPHSPTNLQLW